MTFFILVFSFILLLFIGLITLMVFIYQKRQVEYSRKILNLTTEHENTMLQAQLEIQEQTFQHIAREIHDNIGQKLTLAKLYLNTMDTGISKFETQRIDDSIRIIGEVINDLSDLSRTMSSEIIEQNGLVKAIEFEIGQLNKAGLYSIKLTVTGEGIYLDTHKELILFRIVQEMLNNIIKHADATEIHIQLHYQKEELSLAISDNGKGFDTEAAKKHGNGLSNIRNRASILQGTCLMQSSPGAGTTIHIQIPLYEQEKSLPGHTGG